MTAYLRDFEYDIFLSYGWAGLEDPGRGDRGWTSRFHHALTSELRALLGGHCEIYFDKHEGRTGFLYQRLEESLESSAFFCCSLYLLARAGLNPHVGMNSRFSSTRLRLCPQQRGGGPSGSSKLRFGR
jgi:hypothetical protein